MYQNDYLDMAARLINGESLEPGALSRMADAPDKAVWAMLPGADRLRRHAFGDRVHLCNIRNGKSGRCSEDCAFCAQSAHARTDAPVYPLQEAESLIEGAAFTVQSSIHRYSIVTSGKGPTARDLERITDAFSRMPKHGARYCASLGILDVEGMRRLKVAGVSRYHHNLETPRSHFGKICATHSFDDRVETIRAAKAAGLSVCAGGIFGLGESDRQVVEMALELRSLDVDAVPVNFLVPIPGTRLAEAPRLTPLRCLKVIAILRYALPEVDILVCGGRMANLGELHPFVFMAGASGIMTGNYLTTTGRTLEDDLAMIGRLGMRLREA